MLYEVAVNIWEANIKIDKETEHEGLDVNRL